MKEKDISIMPLQKLRCSQIQQIQKSTTNCKQRKNVQNLDFYSNLLEILSKNKPVFPNYALETNKYSLEILKQMLVLREKTEQGF